MAEFVSRTLRDGAFQGELVPALTIKDSIDSPLGSLVFNHLLTQLSSNILAGKSQSRGIVVVALSRSPSYYAELLKTKGFDIGSPQKWVSVLDCYSDPLGWKGLLMERGSLANSTIDTKITASSCKNVKDMDKLSALITDLGKEIVERGKGRYSVAIDSVSEMLRHASVRSAARLLSNLRGDDQVSCLFCLLHSDLHDDKATSALEYLSSMHANIEPLTGLSIEKGGNSENPSFLEQNFRKAKLCVHFKRRNGRVRVMCDELGVEQSGLTFKSVSLDDGTIAQGLVPKVQFNLQLSEKERSDRERVVLPFEHQGNGKPIEIYDGRKSFQESGTGMNDAGVEKSQTMDSGRGEIIYYRDSDDDMPDSDEDPDDDLDI